MVTNCFILSFVKVKYKEQLEQIILYPHFLQIKYGANPLLFIKKELDAFFKIIFTKLFDSLAKNLFFTLFIFRFITFVSGREIHYIF